MVDAVAQLTNLHYYIDNFFASITTIRLAVEYNIFPIPFSNSFG